MTATTTETLSCAHPSWDVTEERHAPGGWVKFRRCNECDEPLTALTETHPHWDRTTQPTVPEELRDAEHRLRHGDMRVDIDLRAPLAELLHALGDLTQQHTDKGCPGPLETCRDCPHEVIVTAIDFARRITGAIAP